MLKFSIIITALLFTAFSFGCGSGAPTNSGANATANGNTAVKTDQANMPEGFNANPIQPSGNSTPGIPPVVANLPKGVTPTPGIPSPAERKKGMKPGVTPTPGIPSPEEIRKSMGVPPLNANAPSSNQMMMKKNTNKPPRTPQ